MLSIGDYDPLLYGANDDKALVAVEHVEKRGGKDGITLFFRRDGEIVRETDSFEPFIIAAADDADGCAGVVRSEELAGKGELDTLLFFEKWKDYSKARSWLSRETGFTPSAIGAPYLCFNDPVQQYLMLTGRTLFLGMSFEDISRLQVDIECVTSEGYEFCNAARAGDRIVAIGLGDQSGWMEVLSGEELDEKSLLERFVALVRERDPDVIEGHNIFNFDLPYIVERAKRHKVKLTLGRDGSAPRKRPSRFSVGERTISYSRFEVFGRHVVDTMFLLQAYDVSHRSLDGFGLKDAAIHFGFAAKDRTYIEGSEISAEFARKPKRVMDYVKDDVAETGALSGLLSMSGFVQAQILPYSYQNVCVRGNATKIDALMIREYLRNRTALPKPGAAREFAGGYTDIFMQGVVRDVHHCDVRSLYPSLMLTRKLAPRSDELGVFLRLLEVLRDFRLQAKEKMAAAGSDAEKSHFDALQATFKVLINSFYGYLGFQRGRFCDFGRAGKVTEDGRSLLKQMIDWLKEHGAQPVEIDTDGIYYVPPGGGDGSDQCSVISDQREKFRGDFQKSLPEGIEVEFDGEYEAMYSYKMKNYALLTSDGEMVIKGAALKSRGLEPFQRSFLRESIRMRLEGREKEIPALRNRYKKAIEEREWPIRELAKTENLQDAPGTYAEKQRKGKGSKRATYELALRSGREYRAGDQVSYYVTGEKKSVAVHENSKLVSEWDPKDRDENVPYYLAKLEALYKKFGEEDSQQEMGL